MVLAYPADLRRDYQRELLLTFRNQAEDALNAGGVAAAAIFLARTVADWLRTLAVEAEDRTSLSMLGLGSQGHDACGSLDRSTFSVALLLATLGILLMFAGWYEWLLYKALFLSHHRPL